VTEIVELEELRKGDLIIVCWTDASDIRGALELHEGSPEITVKDWGLYLGVSGRKRRFILIGKDVIEVHHHWGAARIPVELVDEIRRILTRDEVSAYVAEVQTLTGRRVRLRRYEREGWINDV